MKILILCTGNSCRSQMAHGFLQSFDKNMDVFSAGTKPAEKVNPMAVKVMSETGIDLTNHTPKNVSLYLGHEWDYVITVGAVSKIMWSYSFALSASVIKSENSLKAAISTVQEPESCSSIF